MAAGREVEPVTGLLRVRVLGPVAVAGLAPTDLGDRKARSLLAALAAARGAPVAVDTIVDVLWGDHPPAKPAQQVSVLASRLRRVLGAERVRRGDGGYELRADWLDVVELDDRVADAAARLAAGHPAAARVAAAAALDLVRGPLAADEDAVWFDAPRASAERTVTQAKSLLAEAALAAGDALSAAGAAHGALDHDPYDERALRLLMQAHVAAGRPASALDAYARTRARLRDDLGVGPAPETEALHTGILLQGSAGTSPPGRPPATTLVGRGAESAVLAGWLARVEAGASVVGVVEGEAGIGKSALVGDWASAAATRGPLVLLGHCDPLGHGLALQPVLDALDRHLRGLPPDDAADLLGAEAAILGPLLAGAPVEGREPVLVGDVDAGQAVLHAALLAVIERARGDGPVVLVIDDVHLAAPGTLAWLSFARRRTPRLLVVATRRSGDGPDLADAERLELGPLDPEALAALVGADRAAGILARSGGNPLFAIALSTHPGEAVPRTVREAVVGRTHALGEAAPTLRAAAVLGPRLDLDLVAGVLRLPVTDVLDAVEHGITAQLLVERAGEVVFAHELVREALAASATAATRAYLHREAALALSARAARDPVAVARHAELGGDRVGAAAALVDAAALAAGRFDLDEAARLLGRAVALDDTAPARLARAKVGLARYRLDDATADVQAALDLGAGAAGLELAGWIAYYRRDYEAVERYADEGIRRATDPVLRSSCLTLAGRLRHGRGDLAAAAMCLEEAAGTRAPDVLAVARTWLASLRGHQGRAEEAVDLAARAELEREPASTQPFAPLHARFAHAYALGLLGRAAEALAVINLLDERVARSGAQGRRFAGVSGNARSWVLRNLGRIEEADECNEAALTLDAGVVLHAEPRFAARLDRVEGHFARHDIDAVGAAVEDLGDLDAWNGTMAWHQRHRFGLQRARLALATGRADDARGWAAEVRDDARARGSSRYEVLATLVLARAQHASGAGIDRSIDLAALLATLPSVAGLEAWWLTAEVARELGDDGWRVASERLVERLELASRPHADRLRRHAAERLSLRSRR